MVVVCFPRRVTAVLDGRLRAVSVGVMEIHRQCREHEDPGPSGAGPLSNARSLPLRAAVG